MTPRIARAPETSSVKRTLLCVKRSTKYRCSRRSSNSPLRSVLSYVSRDRSHGLNRAVTARPALARNSCSGDPQAFKRSLAFCERECAVISAPSWHPSSGHEKGGYGAVQRRIGLRAGGRHDPDEIGERRPETQVALLRVLQERGSRRLRGPPTPLMSA